MVSVHQQKWEVQTSLPFLLLETKQGHEQARRSLGCSCSRRELCGTAASPVYLHHTVTSRTAVTKIILTRRVVRIIFICVMIEKYKFFVDNTVDQAV